MFRYTQGLLFVLVLTMSDSLYADRNNPEAHQSALLDSVISGLRLEHCCRGSLKSCLKEPKVCPSAKRLHAFARWLVQREDDCGKIMEQLEERLDGFYSSEQYAIDTTRGAWAGSPTAPVRIVAYVSSSCNLCKLVVGELYDSVTVGSLSGKAKIMAIPFGTGIGDFALLAANSEGKFWELFESMRRNKTRYLEDDILRMAAGAGIEENRMRALLSSAEIRQTLASARAEGARNGVRVTPTLFINGKRYHSYKDPKWVIDAVQFELEK